MSRPRVSTTAYMQRWLEWVRREHPGQLGAAGAAGKAGIGGKMPVVVGLSGGADSLALTHAACRAGLDVEAVIVDHQLQAESTRVAQRAADQAAALGARTRIVSVDVPEPGEGPARNARYQALGEAAEGRGVLVAHTASDDAEGFLLALSRGSGTDSLAGMRAFSTDHPVVTAGARWIGRPLLHATRADTELTCTQLELDYWVDPHNSSPDYLRSRIRTELLPQMQEVLGQAVADNLAVSSRLLRDDALALDSLAQDILNTMRTSGEGDGLASERKNTPHPLNCPELNHHMPAIRRRIYRTWLTDHTGPLTNAHIEGIDALVIAWRGQGPVAVPWPTHWPTMNQISRTTHRLVVRRTAKQLTLDVIERTTAQ